MQSEKQIFFRVVAVAAIFGVGAFVGSLIQGGVDARAQAAQTAALPFTIVREQNNDSPIGYIVSGKIGDTPAQLEVLDNGWSNHTCSLGQHIEASDGSDTARPMGNCHVNPAPPYTGGRRFGGS